MITFNTSSLYKPFVVPILCRDLVLAGFTAPANYQWKIRNKEALLYTTVFDADDYYKESIAHLDYINPPDHIYPAYTIMDVEEPLKDYMITCSAAGEYEISMHSMYNIESYKAPRMPDAIALLLLGAIRKGIVNQKFLLTNEERNFKH
jgi:hypothetical protein